MALVAAIASRCREGHGRGVARGSVANVLVGVVCVVASISGCAVSDGASPMTSPPNASMSPPPGASKEPAIGARSEFGPFPLRAYAPTPQEQGTLDKAIAIAIGECMRTKGFPDAMRSGSSLPPRDDMSRRYGVMSEQDAKTYGYHLSAADQKGFLKSGETRESTDTTTAEQLAMFGSSDDLAEPTSEPHTGGGCMDQGTVAIYGDGAGRIPLADQMQFDIYGDSQSDPDVIAVEAKWSTCMRGFGYDVPTPVESAGRADLTTATPSEAEITRAIADMTCKDQTDLISVWFKAEVRLQVAAIDARAQELTDDRAWIDSSVRRAARVVQDAE